MQKRNMTFTVRFLIKFRRSSTQLYVFLPLSVHIANATYVTGLRTTSITEKHFVAYLSLPTSVFYFLRIPTYLCMYQSFIRIHISG